VPPLLDRASPLRSSHLRDPVGPQIPLRERILHGRGGGGAQSRSDRVRAQAPQDARDIAVIKAAADKFGWQPRPSPQRQTGVKVNGRASPMRSATARAWP